MLEAIIIGVIAGFIGCKLNGKKGGGCLVDLILGLVGGVVGTFLCQTFDITVAGKVGQVISAAVGAGLVIWIANKLFH